jgi:hypothetical protein
MALIFMLAGGFAALCFVAFHFAQAMAMALIFLASLAGISALSAGGTLQSALGHFRDHPLRVAWMIAATLMMTLFGLQAGAKPLELLLNAFLVCAWFGLFNSWGLARDRRRVQKLVDAELATREQQRSE